MGRVDNTTFYHASIAEYGMDARGVHWNSRQAQEIRFKQLLALLPSDAKEIVDAGCGFGDLYWYMSDPQKKSTLNFNPLNFSRTGTQSSSVAPG
jgi:hypothetical protein